MIILNRISLYKSPLHFMKSIYSGAEKLIQHLHKNNIPIAVATGSDKQGYDLKTSSHTELFKLFSHIVLSSEDPDVKHGKPAPDCFNVASDRFSSKPQTPQQVSLILKSTHSTYFAQGNKGLNQSKFPLSN